MATTPEPPTGPVPSLFTDSEGSTRLLQELGDDWAGVLHDQRRLMRSAIAENKGIELGTEGDSFFVVFASAANATQAVVSAQHALAGHQWTGGKTVRVRMGLHTGEAPRGAQLEAMARAAGRCVWGWVSARARLGGSATITSASTCTARRALRPAGMGGR